MIFTDLSNKTDEELYQSLSQLNKQINYYYSKNLVNVIQQLEFYKLNITTELSERNTKKIIEKESKTNIIFDSEVTDTKTSDADDQTQQKSKKKIIPFAF